MGATEAVIDVLRTDRNHEVREAAGYCLYKLGDPRGIEPLRQAIEGVPDGVIRAKMIGYLANLEGLAAAERLWKWSESKEPWRAIGAAAGLLEIGDPRGGELLLRFAAEGPSDRGCGGSPGQ